jgi:hypothetical protein
MATSCANHSSTRLYVGRFDNKAVNPSTTSLRQEVASWRKRLMAIAPSEYAAYIDRYAFVDFSMGAFVSSWCRISQQNPPLDPAPAA